MLHGLHQATVHTLLNTPHDSSAKMKQLRGLYALTLSLRQWESLVRESMYMSRRSAQPSVETVRRWMRIVVDRQHSVGFLKLNVKTTRRNINDTATLESPFTAF